MKHVLQRHQVRLAIESEPGRGSTFSCLFPAARVVPAPGRIAELLLIPLPGHSFGHCGVAVDRGRAGWLLHAGDAYFSAGEPAPTGKTPFVLRMFQRMADADHRARLHNLSRLRELAASGQVTMHSAHDPDELAREQGEGSQTAA